MRQVISLMHISLDGYAVASNGSMDFIKFDEAVFSYVDTFIRGVDTGLYGPKTFAMMESHWPGVLNDPNAVGHQKSHAQWYASAEKIVFSRTLKTLANPQARLINADLAGAVKTLKSKAGKNIMIFGSPGLVHSFTGLGLIDEFVLSISPVALGAGVPLFKGFDGRLNLELVDTRKFSSGSIACHYRRS